MRAIIDDEGDLRKHVDYDSFGNLEGTAITTRPASSSKGPTLHMTDGDFERTARSGAAAARNKAQQQEAARPPMAM